jgi:hypothetical protein
LAPALSPAHRRRAVVEPLSQRRGHVDHATIGGGNQLGNLILACSRCNGGEKRDQDWQAFLFLKTSGDGDETLAAT